MSIIVQTALTKQEKARIAVVLQRLILALHTRHIHPDEGVFTADIDNIPTPHLTLAYHADVGGFTERLEVRRTGQEALVCRAGSEYVTNYCDWGDDAYFAATYLSELEAAIAAAEAR